MADEFNGYGKLLKPIMTFIDRIGFPILVSFALFWFLVKGLGSITEVVRENSKVTSASISALQEFRTEVRGDHKLMCSDLSDIKRAVK